MAARMVALWLASFPGPKRRRRKGLVSAPRAWERGYARKAPRMSTAVYVVVFWSLVEVFMMSNIMTRARKIVNLWDGESIPS